MAARKSLERDIGSLYFILERIDDLKVQYELIAYLKNNPSLSYENKVRFINRGVFGSLAQTIQAIGERGKGLTESTKVALLAGFRCCPLCLQSLPRASRGTLQKWRKAPRQI